MMLSIVTIRADKYSDIDTEIKFNVATARAENKAIIRFDFNGESEDNKCYSIALRVLKKMKAAGQLQFIAIPTSFSNGDTESEFLKNKYPEVLNEALSVSGEQFIIVKI